MISSFSWRKVRAQVWVKAEELFMIDQMQTWDLPVTPERCELQEGGYFDQAKLIILREVNMGTKNGVI
jgi:hypothetical protein